MNDRATVESGSEVLPSRRRRDSFLVFGEPSIGEEEIAEVIDTLRSGWIGTGPKVRLLEERFSDYVGTRHSLAVGSCTAALHLALDVLGIGPGDEVITTPLTFAATANVIVQRGAVPVFADIDRQTMNIDVAEIEARLTPRTSAIIPVHMAGRPCEMADLVDLARRHDLKVIGDSAHAIEARYHGVSVAQWADMNAFSFYATKNLTTAEGGMVTTNTDAWAEAISVRRLHGLSGDAWKRYSAEGFQPYETIYPGYKYNLTDLQAAIGLPQLSRIEDSLQIRERHWWSYRAAFSDIPELFLPPEDPEPTNRHARHLFVVLLNLELLDIDRDGFVDALRDEGIGSGVHFTPVHLHRYYRQTFGFHTGMFPNAEWVGERTLSLPLSAKLTDEDVADVVYAVRRVLRAHGVRHRANGKGSRD